MATNSTANMRRLLIEVNYDLDLVRVEAWDDEDTHYLGNVMGQKADEFLKILTRKANAAFPGKTASLKVDGFKILPDQ